jgi:hypothetical protein
MTLEVVSGLNREIATTEAVNLDPYIERHKVMSGLIQLVGKYGSCHILKCNYQTISD